MTPFFFGTASRRLFGIYTPGNASSQRGVVLCPPWGQEYLRAHRSIRHLATLLSRAGLHVFRFDYYGTGDSAGDMPDGDLPGWQKDIITAITELKDTSGATRVGLVGLRLGATLAAQAAVAKPSEVDGVVLWDPVVRGDDYLSEIRTLASALTAASVADGVEPSAESAGHGEHILGFAMTPKLATEIGRVDLVASVPKLRARTLTIVSQPLASHDALGQVVKTPIEQLASAPPWLEDKNSGVGAIPVATLQRIVSWFE